MLFSVNTYFFKNTWGLCIYLRGIFLCNWGANITSKSNILLKTILEHKIHHLTNLMARHPWEQLEHTTYATNLEFPMSCPLELDRSHSRRPAAKHSLNWNPQARRWRSNTRVHGQGMERGDISAPPLSKGRIVTNGQPYSVVRAKIPTNFSTVYRI